MTCDAEECDNVKVVWVGYPYENGIPKGKTDLCEECAPTAAEVLSEMTGRDKENFEYDGEIPDFEEQEIEFQDNE